MAKDPAYLDRIEVLLRKHRPDAVMIGTDVELVAVRRAPGGSRVPVLTRVIVASPEVVAIADDKWLTFQFLREHGFSAPASALPGGEDALIDEVGFPLVVKPRVGARSIGVSVVRNRDDLRRAVAALEAPVIQECVATDDDEYTAGTLTFDGRCDASIVMRRDLRDGNTWRAYVDRYPELDATVRRMAEALGAYGPANFQFRVDGGGVKVFEINGRFSGTTPAPDARGVQRGRPRATKGGPRRADRPAGDLEKMTILRYFTETVVRPDELVRSES